MTHNLKEIRDELKEASERGYLNSIRFCHCSQWKLLSGMYDIPKWSESGMRFLFCPWCGSRLVAPCVQCNTPSNEHTGQTIYWKDEKNFCSPVCVMKFEEEETRK